MKFIETQLDEKKLPSLEEYPDMIARNVSKLEKKTYEEFWLSRAKLEIDGYKYVGQKPNDEQSYQKHLATETNVPDSHKRARQDYCFKSCVEETIFQYLTQGYEIVLVTPSFDVEEKPIDQTSFFIKKKGENQELLQKLAKAEEESKKNQDLYARTYAEMKNIVARLKKEKEEYTKYANASLIKDMLPTIDNLYMVIGHAKQDSSLKSFVEGVEITLNGMLSTLKKQGLEEVVAVGEQFNPEYHEAISLREDDKATPGSVIMELQKGYTLNGRLIRPSMVIVAKEKGSPEN